MRSAGIFIAAFVVSGLAVGLMAARDRRRLVNQGLALEATLRREGASAQALLLARGQAVEPALAEMSRAIATPIAQAQVFQTLRDYGVTPQFIQDLGTAARRLS